MMAAVWQEHMHWLQQSAAVLTSLCCCSLNSVGLCTVTILA
jgi:hypothetical protein